MVIVFKQKPAILACAVVTGPLEKRSVFASYFDIILEDERVQQQTNEQGQMALVQETCKVLLKKADIKNLDVDYFLSGDLINQMTPTSFAAKKLAVSFIGLFAACATAISSVIVASLLTELGASKLAIAGATSHHNATERQFRYPVDYGAQKPETAQWTVTASGYALIGPYVEGMPYIMAATIGKVMDYGQTDPFNMGAAMAPAAYQTITEHLQKRGQRLTDYDVVFTGDLGKIGLKLLKAMLAEDGIEQAGLDILRDAGEEYFGEDNRFQAGASGAGCSASVFFSYVDLQLKTGRYQKVLLVATGALLSPLSYQQGDTIPCIAHAIEVTI